MGRRSLAIISCSNGFGHIRRSLILSQETIKLGLSTTLFAPIKKVKYLVKLLDLKSIPNLINFDSNTNAEYYKKEETYDYKKQLKNLSNFDLVVSDNLIEMLEIRPDAIIFGSFFWHKVIYGVSKNKYDFCEELISQNQPRIISSRLFAPEYIMDLQNYQGVGLYKLKPKNKNKILRSEDILISAGTGGNAIKIAEQFMRKLNDYNFFDNKLIFLDKNIFNQNNMINTRKADFSEEMYRRISCAIVRPGIGTITDALYNGVKVFCIFETNNLEMKSNFEKLFLAGLVNNCRNFDEIIISMINYIENKIKIQKYLDQIKKIDFDGAFQSAQILYETF